MLLSCLNDLPLRYYYSLLLMVKIQEVTIKDTVGTNVLVLYCNGSLCPCFKNEVLLCRTVQDHMIICVKRQLFSFNLKWQCPEMDRKLVWAFLKCCIKRLWFFKLSTCFNDNLFPDGRILLLLAYSQVLCYPWCQSSRLNLFMSVWCLFPKIFPFSGSYTMTVCLNWDQFVS